MKVALCGYPPFALQVQESLKNIGIESKFFIRDFVSIIRGGGNAFAKFPPINASDFISFFDFRRLVNEGELDGLIIAEEGKSSFTKNVTRTCKFYEIPKVGVIDLTDFNPFNSLNMLSPEKSYIPYLETNLLDGCNLNCKGCTHFASLFKKDEVYPLETFRRDVRRLSQICDVLKFRLLGGEPLLLQNLDEYIKIAREYLPKTHLQIVTNGVLIPSASQRILDSIRENNCDVDISSYAPTLKILDKIKSRLQENKIAFYINDKVEFGVFLTLRSANNPQKARKVCFNDICRFLRDGKIYKCPVDALSYRFVEKFGVKNYPKATGVDIYAENFSSLIQMLDGNVEMCHWCGETCREIPWQPTNNPQLEDWLAYPEELKDA